jgi:hypothetical protein
MCKADVALLTATACLTLQYLDIAISKLGTTGPWVKKSERITFITASISASDIDCRPYGIIWYSFFINRVKFPFLQFELNPTKQFVDHLDLAGTASA